MMSLAPEVVVLVLYTGREACDLIAKIIVFAILLLNAALETGAALKTRSKPTLGVRVRTHEGVYTEGRYEPIIKRATVGTIIMSEVVPFPYVVCYSTRTIANGT